MLKSIDKAIIINNIIAMSLSSSTVNARIKYKIVVLGDTQVGKTSIIDRFINDRFETSYNVQM